MRYLFIWLFAISSRDSQILLDFFFFLTKNVVDKTQTLLSFSLGYLPNKDLFIFFRVQLLLAEWDHETKQVLNVFAWKLLNYIVYP